MLKLCIWMNIPSHYQSAFFQALEYCADIELRVVYFKGASQDRAAEGWKDGHATKPYERFVENGSSPGALVEAVDGGQDWIHIISGNFSSELVDWFCKHGTAWCHWSEMPGFRLAELLGYRMPLFRLLNPLMLLGKRRDGQRIKNHALGAFGQGRLAHRAFRTMGVPERMIADLYYVPSGLPEAEACVEMLSFSKGRKIFLAVGALCRRKGIDVLLKAFAKLDTEDWCLVLCGLDRANGIYQALARKLGIGDRVLFLGAYPVDRISEVYSAADVFVLPSRFDGWGAVLNEAASLGLPLIGTDLCGGSWHVVEDGRTGFRVRAASVGSLAKAMLAYVEEPELIQKHGVAVRECFRETFTPESNAVRLVSALREWGCE